MIKLLAIQVQIQTGEISLQDNCSKVTFCTNNLEFEVTNSYNLHRHPNQDSKCILLSRTWSPEKFHLAVRECPTNKTSQCQTQQAFKALTLQADNAWKVGRIYRAHINIQLKTCLDVPSHWGTLQGLPLAQVTKVSSSGPNGDNFQLLSSPRKQQTNTDS